MGRKIKFMSEKLTTEELQKLQEQQQQFQKFVLELGSAERNLNILKLQMKQVEQLKEDILKDITLLEEKAEEYQKSIAAKYGSSINVDINTGEFTTIPQ